MNQYLKIINEKNDLYKRKNKKLIEIVYGFIC